MVVKKKFKKKKINRKNKIKIVSSKKKMDFHLYVEKTKNRKGEKTRWILRLWKKIISESESESYKKRKNENRIQHKKKLIVW